MSGEALLYENNKRSGFSGESKDGWWRDVVEDVTVSPSRNTL